MNIEEAIKILKKAKEPCCTEVVGSKWIKGYTTILGTEVDKAIDIVLNELDKNTEIISDLQNEVTIKDAEIERLKEYEYMYKDLCN